MDTWMVDGDGDGYPAPLADEQKSKRGTNCLPDCQPLLLADKHGLFAMQLFTGPPQTIRTSAGLSGPFLTPRAWKGIRPSSRWTPPQVVRRQIGVLQKYIEQKFFLPSIFSNVYFSKMYFVNIYFSKDNHPSSGWRQSQVGRRRQTTYPRRSLQPCCFGEMAAARCSGLKNIARGLLEVVPFVSEDRKTWGGGGCCRNIKGLPHKSNSHSLTQQLHWLGNHVC